MLNVDAHSPAVPAETAADVAATLIAGALVADGTGSALVPADVLIEGTKIAAVEPHGSIAAPEHATVISADGLVLSPGFIDVHSHADLSPLLPFDDTSKILQGVTTEVVGNCGASLAPITAERERDAQALINRMFHSSAMTWHSFEEFLGVTDAAGYVTNYVPLVGQGMLRTAVMGSTGRAATADEIEAMRELLASALEAGAFGMSTGLIYAPGAYSSTDELVGVASALPASAVYATHMRNESDALLDSIREAITIGRQAGCRVQVSHLKAGGRANWGSSVQALQLLDEARAEGVRITQDLYPYTAASTTLSASLPPWAHDGGDAGLLARLQNPSDLARMRAQIESTDGGHWENLIDGSGYDGIMISSTASGSYEGMTLSEIASERGTSEFDALVHVLTSEKLRVSMVEFAMHEADVTTIMVDESTMIGSDGLSVGAEAAGKPHPRLYGTFPRVLGRYVRELGVVDLPTAVQKMTGLPAATFGLTDRGRIAPGFVADLVALDAATVTDVGDYQDPIHTPDGIHWVMQGGHIVVAAGQWQGIRNGIRLRPAHAT